MKFTAEELAAMAAADAEIEATFRLTQEDLAASRERDKEAALLEKDNKRKRASLRNRARYEANREKIMAQKKAYYVANRERNIAWQRAYKEANRERLAEWQKSYYEANREKILARQRAYSEANRAKLAGSQGVRIRDIRYQLGLSKKGFAKLLGVSPSAVCKWESGDLPANWDKINAVLEDKQ